MITSQKDTPLPAGAGRRFVVIAARYNERYVNGLLQGVVETLRAAGAPEPEVWRVPGSWEIPVAAAAAARRADRRPDAVLCLGVIWQGETAHAQYIGEAVSGALMDLAIETGIPVIHGVLSVSTEAQAEARCLAAETNRGVEVARTALSMAELLAGQRSR